MVPKAMMAGAATLERRLEALELRVHALEAAGRPADTQELELRRVLAERTRGLPFTAGELLAHVSEDAVLRAAMRDAMIDTDPDRGAAAVAYWLRGQRHRAGDGIEVRRGRGRRWRVTYRSDT